MGQYYKGSKIGTCESMYYMRLKEAEVLAEVGERDDDGISFKEYLTDGVTRFRFPFADEDGLKNADFLEHPFKSFLIPAGVIADKVNHNGIWISNKRSDGLGSVNVNIPCLHSPEFAESGLKMSMGGAGELWLEIKYQGYRNEKIRTIFGCSRCGAEQWLDWGDVEKLRSHAIEYYTLPENKVEEMGEQARKHYENTLETIRRIS